jgi:hypothetical protein
MTSFHIHAGLHVTSTTDLRDTNAMPMHGKNA